LAVSIENSRLYQSIVYLRDTTILETLEKSITQLTQRDIFYHENYLDVKKLIKDRKEEERFEAEDIDSPLQRARRRLSHNQPKKKIGGAY
jgi:uncharacterized protein YqgQ